MRQGLTLNAMVVINALAMTTVWPDIAKANEAISFDNKIITMVIGFAAGGGTDVAGRLVASHVAKHLPGHPSILVRNVPGADGMTAMNYVLQQTAPDGTTMVMGSNSQVDPMNYRKVNAKFDPTTFPIIGGFSSGGSVVLISKDAEARLFDKSAAPIVMGSTAALPRAAMQMTLWGIEYLGWNARWVVGYPGTNDLITALERSEVDMTATGNAFQIKKLIESGKFKILTQSGLFQSGQFAANDDFGGAPVFAHQMDGKINDQLAKAAFSYWTSIITAEKWIGLTPKTPAEIVAVYRDVFDKVSIDKDFLSASGKIRDDMIPVKYSDMAMLIRNLADTSPEALNFTTSLMEKQGLRASQSK